MKKADSLIGVFGGRGTGKSFRVKKLIRGEARLIVLDIMAEYKMGTIINGDLLALSSLARRKKFRAIFRPDFKHLDVQFHYICRIAQAAGNLLLVIEELNKVTRPGHAPAAWQDITSRGRHAGVRIIGASQRPAGVDKDFIGNMTECFAGRMTYDDDWRSLRMVMGEKARKIPKLANYDQIHWRA